MWAELKVYRRMSTECMEMNELSNYEVFYIVCRRIGIFFLRTMMMSHLTETGERYFRTINLLLTVDCGAYKTGGKKTTKNTILVFLIIE